MLNSQLATRANFHRPLVIARTFYHAFNHACLNLDVVKSFHSSANISSAVNFFFNLSSCCPFDLDGFRGFLKLQCGFDPVLNSDGQLGLIRLTGAHPLESGAFLGCSCQSSLCASSVTSFCSDLRTIPLSLLTMASNSCLLMSIRMVHTLS